jgi:hypothetical protein
MKKNNLLILCFLLIHFFVEASYVPNVPYFYQYNNSINPGGSCQNTSIAMLIKFYGGTTEYPDAISSYYGTSQAQTVSGLETVFNSEAQYFGLTVRDIGHTDGTFADIQSLLAAGKPVIVHGYFTDYGHVMVITGFTGSSYICNDPAGRWSQQYGYGGYCQCNSTEGKDIYYSKSAFEDAIGPNGTIWYHEMTNTYTPPPPSPTDVIKPYSNINFSNPQNYRTNNFTINYTDSDNTGGSGIDKSFYSVLDWNGSEWRANNNNGFYCDNFDFSINNEWTSNGGNWGISSNVLVQSDLINQNTALNSSLNQSLSNRYLYHFSTKINGTATNRGGGIHIFCDDVTQVNRGNNYLIFLRPNVSEIQLFKVTNNTITALTSFTNVTLNNNSWYDIKIMYDRTTGKITIWKNDNLAGTYTDTNPISSGDGISFRSRESEFSINNFKVYRSRPATQNSVSVGNNNSDVRYQSISSSSVSYACKIKSLTVDVAGNISAVANQDVLIDWSNPLSISSVNDGLQSDINYTQNSQTLYANFSASTDINSGIKEYFYSIGKTPGATDVVSWKSNGTSLNISHTNLNLTNGTTYYINVKSLNNAGLYSAVSSSNGQTYLKPAVNNINPIICNGETFTVGNQNYTNPNTYYDTLQSVTTGIDSIVITNLTVNPSFLLNNPVSICSGGSYTINNNTYTSAGTYTDTLQTVNGCDSIVVTDLSVNICTGITQIQQNQKIQIIPNPNNGQFNIKLLNYTSIDKISIIDCIGREVFSFSPQAQINNIDLSQLSIGIYYLRNTGDEQTIKIIIQR